MALSIFIFMLGGVGAITRLMCLVLGKRIFKNFPAGTVIANLISVFLLGFLFKSTLSSELKLILIVGFLGALSTLSSFCADLFLSKKIGVQNSVL